MKILLEPEGLEMLASPVGVCERTSLQPKAKFPENHGSPGHRCLNHFYSVESVLHFLKEEMFISYQ